MRPGWDGSRLDWSAWDKRFGPLLDGSAFADLPRKGVPIECLYLPLHENWPTPIEPNYNGDYWADRAFKPEYRKAFVEASRQFAEHLNKTGWDETLFHGFFNGKLDFKRNGWSRGSSPWLLDEPANFQDFWALRYFGAAFHEGVKLAGPGRAKLVFRCDISRPEWQRDSLDGLLDYNVVGGALRRYQRIVMDRKAAEGQVVVEYGSANPVEESNMQAVGWSLDSWSLGTDGVLPWQTVGRGDSWNKADTLSLFYPGPPRSRARPLRPPQGVPTRATGRRVSDPALAHHGRAALGRRPTGPRGAGARRRARGERRGRGRRRGRDPLQPPPARRRLGLPRPARPVPLRRPPRAETEARRLADAAERPEHAGIQDGPGPPGEGRAGVVKRPEFYPGLPHQTSRYYVI